MDAIRHIIIEIQDGKAPVVQAQGFNVYELWSIFIVIEHGISDNVPLPEIVGVEGLVDEVEDFDDGD